MSRTISSCRSATFFVRLSRSASAELEEEKRKLTEKTLALEQYRQEFFVRADHPHAERRLERLRRRWLAQNAAAVRNVTQQRETLQTELTAMQNHLNELLKRQQLVTQAEDELTDKQTTFEHQQALAAVRNARLEQDLQSAESQRQLIEQQLGKMKEEIERIARQLLEEPETLTRSVSEAEVPPRKRRRERRWVYDSISVTFNRKTIGLLLMNSKLDCKGPYSLRCNSSSFSDCKPKRYSPNSEGSSRSLW